MNTEDTEGTEERKTASGRIGFCWFRAGFSDCLSNKIAKSRSKRRNTKTQTSISSVPSVFAVVFGW